MSIISASTTLTTALQYTADTTGTLVFKTGATPTTALTLNADQSATFAGTVNFATAGFTNLSYTGTLTGGTGVVNLGSGQFYKDASGNVGIGTSSPQIPLDAVSDTNAYAIRIRGRVADNIGTLQFTNNAATVEFATLSTPATNTLAFKTAGVERMRITANGYVGIGTTGPVETNRRLEVGNNSDSTNYLRLNASVSGLTLFESLAIGTASAFFGVNATGSITGGVSAGTFGVGSGDSYPMSLGTNNLERMRITSAGSVCIGTATPVSGCQLTVAGAASVNLTEISAASIEINAGGTGNRNAYIDFHSDDTYTDYGLRIIKNQGANAAANIAVRGTGGLQFTAEDSPAPVMFSVGGGERMRVASSGNVGIGDTNPSYLLSLYKSVNPEMRISDGSATFQVYSASGSAVVMGTVETIPFTFRTAATERMRILSTGGLCVGATDFPSGIGANASCTYTADTFIPGGGYKCKAGISGAYTNTFNINWNGTAQLWIDYTNVGTISLTSDYRIKRNIETQTAPALERVMALRPVTYQMADYGNIFKASDDIKEGFIAHEVQEVIPSGAEGVKDAPDQIQSLRVDAILAVAIKAIQELKAEFDEYKATHP